ncbi:helix-turn-helix domain-containing protein [Streptomyces sp. A30]|uniref:helix-turn-helix domain-containing protein n=1 Tax=Streptomyces sp. A30 TaxID=2789273 RepID=UPI0039805A61
MSHLGLDRDGVGLFEDGPQQRGHPRLGRLWGLAQQISVAPAASSTQINCFCWRRCWMQARPPRVGPTSAGFPDRRDRAPPVRGRLHPLAGLHLLLHRIGWSVQVPAPKATERAEEKIAAWKDEQWPVCNYFTNYFTAETPQLSILDCSPALCPDSLLTSFSVFSVASPG